MNIKTPILLLIALMGAVPLLARANSTQTSSQITKPVTPYGENPNLLHVFAYKAQEGVINTAEKVGKVTEKVSPELNQMSTAHGTTPNLLPQILFKRWIREHSRQLNKLTRESRAPEKYGVVHRNKRRLLFSNL